jgi:hypothetical protein
MGWLRKMGHHDIEERLDRMVENGLRLRLTSHPLTGLSYLEADYVSDPNLYPKPEISWTPRHYYLPAAPSVLSRFTQTLEGAFKTLGDIDFREIFEQTRKLLTSLNDVVANADVEGLAGETKNLIAELRRTNQRVQDLLASGGSEEPSAALPEVLSKMHATLTALEAIVADRKGDIEVIAADLREAALNFRRLSEELSVHPGKLLQKPPKPETFE